MCMSAEPASALPPPDFEALASAAATLGRVLAGRGLRVTSAESCTGGLVAAAITAVAGSSGWFDRGFVTYSNDAKQQQLGVPEALLAAHGAVSEPVARAMAQGAIAASNADLAVAVTGIAGPGGGTPAKPVGLVHLAWADRGGNVTHQARHFAGDRSAVRLASALAALEGLVARVEQAPVSSDGLGQPGTPSNDRSMP
jgi:nicotinamide-nucleotide amidase